MKKLIGLLVFMVLITGLFAGNVFLISSGSSAAVAPGKKVEVFYFHFTRRCTTCNNVEKVSKEAVETLYAAQVKTGEITFKSINLDEKAGEAIGAKYKIEGQTLIVISGDKQVDLTDKGFLYANDSPAKLKAVIKKTVDGMIK